MFILNVAQDSAELKTWTKEFFRLGAPDELLPTQVVPAKNVEAIIHMTSQDWPKLRESVVNSVLQALLCATEQAAPGFPDADFGLSLRLAVSTLAKVRLETKRTCRIHFFH